MLASANRGLLYVDEVNLLDDHVVTCCSTRSANGRQRGGTEGIISPTRQVHLVGTMNPEEGDLLAATTRPFRLCRQYGRLVRSAAAGSHCGAPPRL
ncbi:MAG: hypothetical protein M5U34_15750 [Chloroflexi bacterium]|nr:hypothetical protein [Chloroflexota bacterium]